MARFKLIFKHPHYEVTVGDCLVGHLIRSGSGFVLTDVDKKSVDEAPSFHEAKFSAFERWGK